MANEFYQDAAARQGKQLQYRLRNAQAALLEAEQCLDVDTAGRAIQEIADIEAEGARLNALHRAYTAPPRGRSASSIMDSRRLPQNGDDALEIINYGKLPNDPTRLTAEEYNRQQSELHRLKATKGMYRD